MAARSYDAVAEKILIDMDTAVKRDASIITFEVIPTLEIENKNRCPVLKVGQALGLESWSIPYIYPYAHHQVMDKQNCKVQKVEKLLPCLLGVALLNPEMPVAWSVRRELIVAKKLPIDRELQITKLALSRKPKCNEGLIHRRWVLTNLANQGEEDPIQMLQEELHFAAMIADRYHSNYHAWNHRIWCLQHLPHHTKHSIQLHMNHTLSMSQLNALLTSSKFNLIHDELDSSLKWVSSHVSDHSGMHFRQFLITQLINIITTSHGNPPVLDENRTTCFVANIRTQLKEFLQTCELITCEMQSTVTQYLALAEERLTVFDVVLMLLVQELKSNLSLSSLYENHESLWYYRRFLVFRYFQTVETIANEGVSSYTKNGCEGSLLHCRLQKMFKVIFMDGEHRILMQICGAKPLQVSSMDRVTSNYKSWLQNTFNSANP